MRIIRTQQIPDTYETKYFFPKKTLPSTFLPRIPLALFNKNLQLHSLWNLIMKLTIVVVWIWNISHNI